MSRSTVCSYTAKRYLRRSLTCRRTQLYNNLPYSKQKQLKKKVQTWKNFGNNWQYFFCNQITQWKWRQSSPGKVSSKRKGQSWKQPRLLAPAPEKSHQEQRSRTGSSRGVKKRRFGRVSLSCSNNLRVEIESLDSWPRAASPQFNQVNHLRQSVHVDVTEGFSEPCLVREVLFSCNCAVF